MCCLVSDKCRSERTFVSARSLAVLRTEDLGVMAGQGALQIIPWLSHSMVYVESGSNHKLIT